MQVILPVAGLGTRLRPQTWSRPKPLVTVAGKTLIDHVLDRLSVLEPDRVIFITGYLGDQIEEHIRTTYDFDAVFVEQKEQLGQSHAIYEARDVIDGPAVVLFPDMIFEADLALPQRTDADGILYVMSVDDPSRFGVVIVEDGRITKLVEKPDEPVSNLAVMGVYYFRDSAHLIRCIERQLESEHLTKGEYFLADAMQMMIDDGARFVPEEASVWQDAGTNEALLDTNRYLLDRVDQTLESKSSVLIPPVLVDPTATINNSVVGPYASVGKHAEISDSIVRDSIVDNGAQVYRANITRSIIGRDATLRGKLARANIGDNSDVELAWDEDQSDE